jgi:hypothetical protein
VILQNYSKISYVSMDLATTDSVKMQTSVINT